MQSLQFSPDDQFLAFTHYRSGISIWDWKRGKLKTRLVSPYRGHRQLAYSPDGSKIAATNEYSNILDVFDLATQKRLAASRAAHEAGPSFLKFLDDGKSIVTAGDDGSLRLWDSHTGKQKLELRHPPNPKKPNETRWIRAAAVSPGGELVATSSFDNTVRLWNLKTKKEIYRLPGHGRMGGHRALAFTPDGRRFASWGDDMRVYVWDVATGKLKMELKNEYGDMVFSPDGRFFVTGGNVFEAASGKRVTNLRGKSTIRALAFSHDGRFLATATSKTIYVWDVATWKKRKEFKGHDRLTTLTFTRGGKLLSGSGDTTVLVWDLK
ncbi:MAG: WD40 repeat domain-containing protein [Planctomycetes bacterium]|nr:WD40 repeat domain-containing protein [Planctomycetota bacterium]